MPIIGIMASSRRAFEPAGAYDSLATVTLSATTASITFAGIPANYKHLQIRLLALSATSAQGDLQLNSDTGNNYAAHLLEGNGATPSASAGTSRADVFSVVRLAGTSSNVAASVIDILDYANTNKYKTIRHFRGFDSNGAGNIGLGSGLWMNTSAISSLTITARAGTFTQYSSFALYGVK
jgi:hypothetical protein